MQTNYQFSPQVMKKSGEMGYLPDQLPLLFLVPFVQVAWAEGSVQAGEQKAILHFAANLRVSHGHPFFSELINWFDERPTDDFFNNSIEDLRCLLEEIPAPQAANLRSMIQIGCVEVAKAVGDTGFVRSGSNIRREEKVQLQNITEQLGLSQIFI
jgi:hypothetical protein